MTVNLDGVLKKKVVGVPVLYVAGALVLVLAIVAYRTKSSASVTTDASTADAANASGADATANDVADAYSGFASNGTVVVAPVTPTPTEATAETNETWAHSAIQYLIDSGEPPGDAQTAITLYLQGANLSFSQGAMRDKAIKKLGIPPEPLESIGKVSGKAARKQILRFPGYHTVENDNDNNITKIAGLEYGSTDTNHVDEIVSANAKFGGRTATLPVGTKVYVPMYRNPQYFTATASVRSEYAIAKKFKTNSINIEVLNPDKSFPVAVGTKVRVG